MKKINILVTGCGGDIGQSIGKILNELDFVDRLYGCDISDRNAARFIFENFFVGLPCSNPDYVLALERVVIEKGIDLVIPVSEPELRFFSKKGIFQIGSAELIMASENIREVGFDKLKTVEFLQDNQLPYPVSYLLENVDCVENYPVIVKSKTGSGSTNVNIVHDIETLNFFKKKNSDLIVQEYLSADNGEFTCGVFRSSQGEIRTIIMRRELMGGFSGYGQVVQDPEVEEVLIRIAEAINLVGSVNAQLRITTKGPTVFEINPRFSSTVRFRDLLGFKDVLWSVEDKMNMPISEYTITPVGKQFFKGFSEYVL